MLLLAVAVLVGLVAGWLRPPLGTYAARPRFTWVPLLGAGAALNLAAYLLEGRAATFALVASLVLLLGFVAVNTHVTGVAVIGVGLLCNLAAVVLNDGMPVRGEALVAAGVVEEDELDTLSFAGARHLERAADTAPILGDVLPVPLPVAPEVLSFGDLIVVIGAADAVRDLARRRHRRHVRAPGAEPGWTVVPVVVDLEVADTVALPAHPEAASPVSTDHLGSGPLADRSPSPRRAREASGASAALATTSATEGDPPPRRRRFTGPGEPSRPLVAPTPSR